MAINFSAFDIGLSALQANQLGLNVTGQNIANVNTPGYAQQSVVLSPTAPQAVGGQLVGGGVTVDQVQSSRDQFIQNRLQTENGNTGRLTAQSNSLAPIDAAFSDTGNGISTGLTNFFGAFSSLQANPTDNSLRTAAIASGVQLGASLSFTRSQLTSAVSAANQAIGGNVQKANSLATQIASLNSSIQQAQGGSGNASDLITQRDQAVNSLTELTGVSSTQNSDGTISLTLGDGSPLVLGDKAFSLQATPTGPSGLYSLTLNGKPAAISNGEILGQQDAIGQISSQISQLDSIASSLATAVNTIHQSGTDLNGNPGGAFFTSSDGNPISAANLTVSAAIQANPSLLAVAAAGAGTGDGSVAASIANLETDTNQTAGSQTGSFPSIYSSLVSTAGSALQTANDGLTTQQAIMTQTTNQAQSESGVDLDQEAVNMLSYQRAYEAAAQFITAANQITEAVIQMGQ
ncbi:MAG TPA: flagellar hook-associated protein FlgK [Blastocatellia bacterium]|nr:flagellar hook-associated protein FlgK [Blastocatellia bacterium]